MDNQPPGNKNKNYSVEDNNHTDGSKESCKEHTWITDETTVRREEQIGSCFNHFSTACSMLIIHIIIPHTMLLLPSGFQVTCLLWMFCHSAIPISHYATYSNFFVIDFSSWCMLELMFAITTEQQNSVLTLSRLLIASLVELSEESLTWASVLSQTYYRWMAKPAFPV